MRGVSAQVFQIIRNDNKITAQQRIYISGNLPTNISITNISHDIGLVEKTGIKALLRNLEDGASGKINVCTSLVLENSLFSFSTLSDAYSVIKLIIKKFTPKPESGTEEQWQRLLKDLSKSDNKISTVFEKYDVEEKISDDLCVAVSGFEYHNWLVFLYFKYYADKIQNTYLKLI